jgi:Flp pilus assembly protein TadG
VEAQVVLANSLTPSLRGFCNVPNLERNDSRGQSTIEFAFVAPLVLGCAVLLIATTTICLQVIQLHDVVRTTTRVAVTTDNPTTYALDMAAQLNLDITVEDDLETGMVTLHATRKTRIPLWGGLSKLLGMRATATMMRESPPVLSR